MKLRILSILLALILLASLVACGEENNEGETSETESTLDTGSGESSSLGEEENDPGDPADIFTQKTDENGNITLTELKDFERTVYTIPEGVVALGNNLFSDHQTVEKIILPSTLTTIGRAAFDGCISLEEIEIPASVTVIPERAFNRCERLSKVVLNEGVTTIETDAFGSCISLYDIEIPESVTRIYKDAFAGCTELIEVTRSGAYYIGNWVVDCKATIVEDEIRDGVVGIADCAFYEAKELESLVLPATLKYIGAEAFAECGDLKTLKLTKDQDEDAPNVLPNGVVSVGERAFMGCSDLTNITISATVENVGTSAFVGCTKLKSIAVEEGNEVYTAVNNCLIETATKTLLAGCKDSVIPADGSVTAIAPSAFEGCTALKTIVIPDKVVSIGSFAFSGCKKLEAVTLSKELLTIGDSAFDCCAALKTIVLPEKLTELGAGAFYKCAKLSSLTISSKLTAIAPSTFEGCAVLETVVIPETVTTLGEKAFSGCKKLASVTLPENLASIGISAFEKCAALTAITFPETLKTIGDSAFAGCSMITSLAFPATLETFGSGAFSGMAALSSITVAEGNAVYKAVNNCLIHAKSRVLLLGCKDSVIPTDGSISIIGKGAFEKNTELKSVVIPASVTAIGEAAFARCSALESVTIPASVLQIGNDAFVRCTMLRTVNYTGGAVAWSEIKIGTNNAKLTDKDGSGATIYYNYNDGSSSDGEDDSEEIAEDMQGLNVLAMGDSLFYGSQTTIGEKQWINLLGNRFNWNLTNLGIGGATISWQPDRLINGASIANVSMYDRLFNHFDTYNFGSDNSDDSRYYNCGTPSGAPADVDIILLQAGSNDYGPKVQAPVGTVDSTDHTTFLGAWRLVVDKLLELYPNATVVMMTAWENGNQGREDNANAIEFTSSVATLYDAVYKENARVKFIDSGDPEVSGVDMRNANFKNNYAYDSFHLNDAGMALMAEAMIPYLHEIVVARQ